MVLYGCSGSPSHLDKWTQHDGVQCYSSNMPPSWFSCRSVFVAWAVGSEGECVSVTVCQTVRIRGGKTKGELLERDNCVITLLHHPCLLPLHVQITPAVTVYWVVLLWRPSTVKVIVEEYSTLCVVSALISVTYPQRTGWARPRYPQHTGHGVY